MEKNCYVSDLMPGTVLERALFQVRKPTPRPDGTNLPKIKVMLADKSGECLGTSYTLPDDVCEKLLAANAGYVYVWGVVQADKYEGQVKMNAVEIAPTPSDIAPFMPDFPKDHGDTVERFNALVGSIGYAPLFAVLKALFRPEMKAFREAHAAEGRHHAYRGGLLRHTVEVAELCQKACDIFPELRHDLLVCAALLHDYGKLRELDVCGDLTDTGVLIGHVSEGAYHVRRAVEAAPELPAELAMELTHLVLSHHGTREWGAPILPATLEAQVLPLCDQMSANITHFVEKSKALAQSGSRFSRTNGETIWVGGSGSASVPDLSGKKTDVARKLQSDPFGDEPLPVAAPPLTVRLPLLGWVAAGSGDQGSANDSADEWRDVVMPHGGADFLLRVTGDSMIGAGIVEKDILFVKRTTDTPRIGQIVVASVPESVSGAGGVVKRWGVSATNTPILVSENSDYPPIPVTSEVLVQGVVVHLLRDYG